VNLEIIRLNRTLREVQYEPLVLYRRQHLKSGLSFTRRAAVQVISFYVFIWTVTVPGPRFAWRVWALQSSEFTYGDTVVAWVPVNFVKIHLRACYVGTYRVYIFRKINVREWHWCIQHIAFIAVLSTAVVTTGAVFLCDRAATDQICRSFILVSYFKTCRDISEAVYAKSV
jgi:hypothetical protein